MSAPILGTFDPNTIKKRRHIRTEVDEEFRNTTGKHILSTYPELLSRAFNLMQNKNPDVDARQTNIKLPSPNVTRKGKKTHVANFTTICDALKRSTEHLKQYINTEMNTDSSIDGTGCLIISGRLQSNQIEKLIFNYIITYVQCPVCKCMDTYLEKGNRLQYIKCNRCTAQRTVQQIKAGFVANTKKHSQR